MENAGLLELINQVLVNAGKGALPAITDGQHLRNDLGLDSFHLAELTVRIEDSTGVDIFADGIVSTVGEIRTRLQ